MNLRGVVESFAKTKVLLIGDTILDMYTYGSALGLSAETPTIVARKKETRVSLGGAALVCNNLLELGAHVQFVSLVGDDEEARYVKAFSRPNLRLRALTSTEKPTTVKHRFWVDGYKLFQLDIRDDRPIESSLVAGVIEEVGRCLPDVDLVAISDYRHGLLTEELLAPLLALIRRSDKPLFVDSQVSQTASNHRLYRGASVMCLNLKEARCIDAAFEPVAHIDGFATLVRELGTDQIVVKLGEEGALMLGGERTTSAPAIQVNVVDTTGAGDAFLSALCLAYANGPELALKVANAWAGLAVQVHGTVPARRMDLIAMLDALDAR